MTKDELIRQNEELKRKLRQLKTKYVWGLQVEDFANAAVGTDEPIDEADVFSEDEMTDNELNFHAFHALRINENYTVQNWYDDISEASEHFSDDTMKLLRTAAKRWLTTDTQ